MKWNGCIFRAGKLMFSSTKTTPPITEATARTAAHYTCSPEKTIKDRF